MISKAKLHIQGVGCYKPLEAPKRLLVIFPDGTPDETTPDGICMHLNFVQFRAHHLAANLGGLGGYVTRFIDRELLTIDTGNGDGQGIQSLDLTHLPTMEEALPLPSQADLRPIDPDLLDPKAPDSRVMGKLLVEAGVVNKHDDPRYTGKWYFRKKEDAKKWSSVTTVTYSGIDQFVLRFRPLGGGAPVEVPLVPDAHSRLEVWVRNMCDGFPPEEVQKYEVASDNIDRDFVLNYKVRGNSGPEVVGPVPTRVPEIGTETRKCMGSV